MSSGKRRLSLYIHEDQLRPDIGPLREFDPSELVVLLIESIGHQRRLPFHKKRVVFVWSAMRHFAEELRGLGYEVDYRALQPDFAGAVREHVAKYDPVGARMMESAEFGVTEEVEAAYRDAGVALRKLPNDMFLSDGDRFAELAGEKRAPVMETFYRDMRRRTGLLMEDGEPVGGKWNFDKENRRSPGEDLEPPPLLRFQPDETTEELVAWVRENFQGNFGRLEGFDLAVTREQAREAAADFMENRLDFFGPYQDAMVAGQDVLYHSLLSPYLNVGLLYPMELCRMAEARLSEGQARVESVEGFVRQVIGWREFVYRVYRREGPDYLKRDALLADQSLPEFYWSGRTRMRCVREALRPVLRNGINHHIQRLMITGNFALLAGISPQELNAWYHLAYVDAWEWVVSPNVLGMALYADGGLLATKPYAASANYIHKMSDYCGDCEYRHDRRTGEGACPFNALYWDFLARHRRKFAKNHRMGLVLKQLEKKSEKELGALRRQARRLRRDLDGL